MEILLSYELFHSIIRCEAIIFHFSIFNFHFSLPQVSAASGVATAADRFGVVKQGGKGCAGHRLGLLVIDLVYELADAVELPGVAQREERLALLMGERAQHLIHGGRPFGKGRTLLYLRIGWWGLTGVAASAAVGLAGALVVGHTHVRMFTDLTACAFEGVYHDHFHVSKTTINPISS